MADFGANMILKAKMDSSDFDQGMHRARKNTKDFQDSTKKANGQLRMMRGGLGQLGHQVQDVAVQLQMGQNAMLVFGQQGSQVASLFGPRGAMIGAVLAVGAAIATSLAPSMFGATQAAKDLKEEMKNLADNYDDATAAQKEYARIQTAKIIKENEEAAGKAEEKIVALTQGNKENIRIYENLTTGLHNNNDALSILTRGNSAYASVLKFTKKAIEGNHEALITQQTTIDTAIANNTGLAEKVDNTTDAFIKFTDKTTLNNIKLAEGTLGVQLYNIAISNMTAEEKLVASAQAESLFIQQRINEEREAGAKAAKSLHLRQIMSGIAEETAGIKKGAAERQRKEAKEAAMAAAQQKRFEATRDQYTLQIASIGKTADQIDILKMRQQGYNEAQIQEITRLKELEQTRQANHDAEIERQAAGISPVDATSDIMNNFSDMDDSIKSSVLSTNSMVVGTVASTMGSISQLFKEGSSEAKAFMLVSKGLEAANAIIAGLSGEMAIKAAYAKMALANPAMATAYTAMGNVQGTMMKTMGFVNAGLIMGQAAASFDGGGFTGMGARAGGVDGKGGFPAILHPNETVIDHSKGQSMATNVTINIQANDTKGFDELLRSRRGEIIGIVNKAINNRGVSSLI